MSNTCENNTILPEGNDFESQYESVPYNNYNTRNSNEYLTSINYKSILNNGEGSMRYQNLSRIMNAESLRQSYAFLLISGHESKQVIQLIHKFLSNENELII